MKFKEFDEYVKTYYPLGNNRYMVLFNGGEFEFYKQEGDKFIKEVEE